MEQSQSEFIKAVKRIRKITGTSKLKTQRTESGIRFNACLGTVCMVCGKPSQTTCFDCQSPICNDCEEKMLHKC
jgi:hypothetical protein